MFKNTDAVIEWVDAWVVHHVNFNRNHSAAQYRAVSAELATLRAVRDAAEVFAAISLHDPDYHDGHLALVNALAAAKEPGA